MSDWAQFTVRWNQTTADTVAKRLAEIGEPSRNAWLERLALWACTQPVITVETEQQI